MPALVKITPKVLKISFYFIVFLLTLNSFSQNLNVSDIDASLYPLMKAKLYATDYLQNPITDILAEDIKIFENDKACKEIKIKCFDAQPVSISTVLTLDISGSMAGANIEAVKNAASMFVNLLPSGNSECGIVSFDDYAYINTDLTSDKIHMQGILKNLRAQSGTNYNVAFDESFKILNNAKYSKFMIFLTDGQGNANQTKIISEATEKNITVYCITVGITAPQELKNIANSTKGMLFENVRRKEDIVSIFEMIFYKEFFATPCEISWKSSGHCSETINLDTKIAKYNLKSHNNYTIPTNRSSGISIIPKYFNYFSNTISGIKDTFIEISARNNDFKIISAQSSNPEFSIPSQLFPITIKKGEKKQLPVKIQFSNIQYKSTEINFKVQGCTDISYFMSVRTRSTSIANQEINVLFPNGGETFVCGSDTTINFAKKGILDNFKFEYSLDSGKKWINIPCIAKNNHAAWRVPNITSDKALVKITAYKKRIDYVDPTIFKADLLKKSTYIEIGIPNISMGTPVFNIQGNKMAISYSNNKTYVIDLKLNKVIYSIDIGSLNNNVSFNMDGTKLYIFEKVKKNAIFEFNAENGKFIREYPKLPVPEMSCFLGDDETIIIGDVSSNIYIYQFKTGKLISKFKAHDSYLRWISLSNNKSYLLSASFKGDACVWDINTQKKIFSTAVLSSFPTMQLSPDNTKVFIGDDEQSYIHDIRTKKKYFVDGYFHHTSSSDFEGRYVFSSGKIIDFNTGIVKKANFQNYCIGSFSPDNLLYIFDQNIGSLSSYNISQLDEKNVFDDKSDQTFSIVKPKLNIQKIDFGKVTMGNSIEMIVNDFIKNISTYPSKVIKFEIIGPDASSFILLSKLKNNSINANTSLSSEFKFYANKIGLNRAQIKLYTPYDTLIGNISADVIKNPIICNHCEVDFGKVIINTKKDTCILNILTNTSSQALTIENASFMNNYLNEFIINETLKNKVLKTNESLKVLFKYEPRSIGTKTNYCQIKFKEIKEPININLKGTGVAPPLNAIINCFNSGTNFKDTLKSILIEEYNSKNMRPLLNYVFFDYNSSEIPNRYVRFDADMAEDFDLSDLNNYEALQTYYQILNIIGKRLKDKPTANIRLIGCNSNEQKEKLNLILSKNRAENIKNYFINTWNIDKNRIIIESRNLPEKNSVGSITENFEENRRVEITSNDLTLLEPVISNAKYRIAIPKKAIFKLDASKTFPIKEWKIKIMFNGKVIKEFKGDTLLPDTVQWNINNDKHLLSLSNGKYQYQLYILNSIGQSLVTTPNEIQLKYLTSEELKYRTTTNKVIDKYELILFNFNEATLSPENKKIIDFVRSQIPENAEIKICGYTDKLGEENFNLKLSENRAIAVKTNLNMSNSIINVFGESEELHDIKFPEGRFYSRTVYILVESNIK